MLNDDEWSFTSFSASCVKCGRDSEPGDVFYSGLSVQETTEADESSEDTPSQNGLGNNSEETDDNDRAEPSDEGQDEGEVFQRIDYCSNCWNQITPDFFSYWKTEVPEPEEEDQEPDRSTLAGLWRGLLQQPEEETTNQERDPINPESDLKHGLIYLLTLMLMRKGYLALEQEIEGERSMLEVRVKGTDDDRYKLIEPKLAAEQIESVKEELADLLDMEETENQE